MKRAAAAALVVLAATPAAAYVRSTVPESDVCLYWAGRTIPWHLNDRGHERFGYQRTLDVVRKGFATWDAISCSDMTFAEQPSSASRTVGWKRGEDPDNLILFRFRSCVDVVPEDDPCWTEGDCSNVHDCWGFSDGIIAVTTTSFNSVTGELIDADIELNAATFAFTDVDGPPCELPDTHACVATDMQNTVTHEIGHVLGLAHSALPAATMSASAPNGDVSKRTLDGDDVDGVCTMYPDGKPSVTCFAAFRLVAVDSSQGCSCATTDTTSAGLLVTTFAWLGFRRRLRRRPLA